MIQQSPGIARHGGRRIPGLLQALLLVVLCAHPIGASELQSEHAATWSGPELEVRLVPGQILRWRIPPMAGDFLRLTTEQQGTDVVLTLHQGDESTAVDAPRDPLGPEVLIVPTPTKEAWLEVFARTTGTLRLTLEAVSPREDDERRIVAAQRRLTAAGEPWLRGDPEGLRQTLGQLLQAVEILRHAEAPRLFPHVLYRAAVLHHELGDGELARGFVEEVRELAHRSGNLQLEALAQNRLGLLLWDASDPQAAATTYHRALALLPPGTPCVRATVLNNLGTLSASEGRGEDSLELYEEALSLCSPGEDPALAAVVLAGLGGMHWGLGEVRQALDLTQQALPLLQTWGTPREVALALTSTGVYARNLGEFQIALDAYGKALELFHQLGDSSGRARVLNGMGQVYSSTGEPQQARSVFETALALRQSLGDRRGEANTLHSLGRLLALSEDPVELTSGLEFAHHALDLRRTMGHRTGEARTLEVLGLLHRRLGDLPAAHQTLRQALDAQQILGNQTRQGAILREIGETHLEAGEATAAKENLLRAKKLFTSLGDDYRRTQTLGALARAELRQGHLEAAADALAEALRLFEILRREILDPGLRTSFTATRSELFDTALALALKRHRQEPDGGHELAALDLAESYRARGLFEWLSEARDQLGEDPHTTRRELARSLGDAAVKHRRLLARGASAEIAAQAEAEVQRRLTDLQGHEAAIRRDSSPLPRVAPLSHQKLDQLIEPGTTLLYYALAEETSLLWIVRSGTVRLFPLAPRHLLEEEARSLHRELSTLDPVRRISRQRATRALAQQLLGPAAQELAASQRLVVVPDGALHYIPFAALPDPATDIPLLAQMEVVRLPSLAVLDQLRLRDAQSPELDSVAILADPIFSAADPRLRSVQLLETKDPSSLPRLAHSRTEAEAIAALTKNSLLLLGPEADREALFDDTLEAYSIVHFATHGVLDDRRPLLSGLALSAFDAAGRPRSDFLSLADIYGLRLGASLVVLSGCGTALGRETGGEGFVGLVQGFLHAGAKRVVASLWPVQDRATARLMESFYRAHLERGESTANALRSAQIELIENSEFGDPFYWAPFVHIGDWRPVEATTP